jgi:Na+-transporting NADH:ubiquinone oxidoreductase subunit C
MKQYISMFVFVLILGIVASGILIGMDYLTADLIESNREVELRKTVLEAFEVSYRMPTINETFESEIEVREIDGLNYYIAASGDIGFTYEGSGVWGPIKGFLALNQDLETLRFVSVLQQEETPGLGGVVAERAFLEQFVGIKIVPQIEINQDSGENKPNEVDAITGATRTSKAFETILNTEYQRYIDVWQAKGN